MFKGLSSLRAGEKKEVPLSEKAKAMQAYLAAQYGGGDGAAGGEKKKKKKKKRPEAAGGGLKILDQDVSGFAAPSAKAAKPGAPPLGRGLPPGAADEEDEEEEGGERGTGSRRGDVWAKCRHARTCNRMRGSSPLCIVHACTLHHWSGLCASRCVPGIHPAVPPACLLQMRPLW